MPRKKVVSDRKSSDDKTRPPVVTILGHVDHGKTTLLDAIRKSHITEKEFGGITQHINAYKVKFRGKEITFIDTPGHEAFSEMRARGGKVADIVILVISASDGVMPQTKEAIFYAKEAGVPIIVAINKIDLAGADPSKVKKQLADEGLIVEEFGGDVVSVEVSAKKKINIDNLLEMILLVSEVSELDDTSNKPLRAVVIESRMEQKRGPVGVLIIKEGVLRKGEEVFIENKPFKVKFMSDENGKIMKAAYPSDPVYVLGFDAVPQVGSIVSSNKFEQEGAVEEDVSESASGDLSERINSSKDKVLNIILKADTNGTLEAIIGTLLKVKKEEARVQILSSGIGEVNESDVRLASATSSVIIAFNVKTQPAAEYLSKHKGIEINKYSIIYDLKSDIEQALDGILSFEESQIKGRAKVLKIFNLPSGDVIAGAEVLSGRLKVGDKVEIYRDMDHKVMVDEGEDDPLFKGIIKKLKRGRDSIELVGKGSDCGILFKPQFKDLIKGAIIEVM